MFDKNLNIQRKNTRWSYQLAGRSIASQNVGVLVDGQSRGLVLAHLQGAAPLGEATSLLVVLLAALGKIVEALGGGLGVGALQVHHASVHLDAGDDATLGEHLREGLASGVLLVHRLVEQDDTRDVVVQLLGGGEEQVAVGATIRLGVLEVDVGETLADGS